MLSKRKSLNPRGAGRKDGNWFAGVGTKVTVPNKFLERFEALENKAAFVRAAISEKFEREAVNVRPMQPNERLLILEAKITESSGLAFYGCTEDGSVFEGLSPYPDNNEQLTLMRLWRSPKDDTSGMNEYGFQEVSVWCGDELSSYAQHTEYRWFVKRQR